MVLQVPIPNSGITDAEMWKHVDEYQLQKRILRLLNESCSGVFLTNRKRLEVANVIAVEMVELVTSVVKRLGEIK